MLKVLCPGSVGMNAEDACFPGGFCAVLKVLCPGNVIIARSSAVPGGFCAVLKVLKRDVD